MLDKFLKEKPLLGLEGLGGGNSFFRGIGSADGDSVYVDDVFSAFIHNGTTSTQTITNGIDLAGKGGLVWFKSRGPTAYSHCLIDSERGIGDDSILYANNTSPKQTNENAGISALNANGFTLRSDSDGLGTNYGVSGDQYTSWTFRKKSGFFDVVTYTGNGVQGRAIPHNLGSTPGFIMVKRTDLAAPWVCYHRSLGATKYISLNSDGAEVTSNQQWSNTEPTSSVFTVHDDSSVNLLNATYVAYLFAHDDQSFGTSGDQSIIKCGSISGNGSQQDINLGFEPQWVLVKRTDFGTTESWVLWDIMRGMPVNHDDARLYPNLGNVEESGDDSINPTPTGFSTGESGGLLNTGTHIYIAIRRPHKPPTAATEVFNVNLNGGTSSTDPWTPGFVPDLLINTRQSSSDRVWAARLLGNGNHLVTNGTNAESTSSNNYFEWDALTNQMEQEYFQGGNDNLRYTFGRAPGFMDIVTYNGNGTNRTITHNLEAVPELMVVKRRDSTGNWVVYTEGIGNTPAASYYVYLNSDSQIGSSGNYFNDTAPTSSVLTIGASNEVNNSSGTYIVYLFATLSGISKVGSYTGTNSDIDIDCGFTNGARFVMIKRTDNSGNWYVFDTTRGIGPGNDPYIYMNSTAAETTDQSYLDPYNPGFQVTNDAPAGMNTDGGNYIYLAIA